MEPYPNQSLSPKRKKKFRITQKNNEICQRTFPSWSIMEKRFSHTAKHELAIQRFKSLEKRILKNLEFFNMTRVKLTIT